MVDLLGSEYKWTVDYVMNLPIDQTEQLYHAMLNRRGVKTIRANPDVETPSQSLADKVRGIFGGIDTNA